MALLTTATASATTTMIYGHIIFAFLFFILFSNCNGSTVAAKQKDQIAEAFDSFFTGSNVEDLFKSSQISVRMEILGTIMLKSNKFEFINCNRAYGIIGLIYGNYATSLKVYLHPAYRLNFNYYFKMTMFEVFLSTYSLFDGNSSTIKQDWFTPLQLAVALNKVEVVQSLVEASLVPKLKLNMPHAFIATVDARTLARKIYNPTDRDKMLQFLIINKEKHDMDLITQRLRNELTITVKEAVLANNIEMVESALLLGNFGSKTDINVIRWAMLNENIKILEILVMEGYAIPPVDNRPPYKTMNKYDVNFLLDNDTNRHPLPYRTSFLYL